eukprot:scaffold45598_cov33-Tisochrysis_lutea.AAC.1
MGCRLRKRAERFASGSIRVQQSPRYVVRGIERTWTPAGSQFGESDLLHLAPKPEPMSTAQSATYPYELLLTLLALLPRMVAMPRWWTRPAVAPPSLETNSAHLGHSAASPGSPIASRLAYAQKQRSLAPRMGHEATVAASGHAGSPQVEIESAAARARPPSCAMTASSAAVRAMSGAAASAVAIGEEKNEERRSCRGKL